MPKEFQLTFDAELARDFQPDERISEPALWFKNLWYVRALGAGTDVPNLIRQFEFRQGLNILWAEPEKPKKRAGLYQDGIAGHSTGKSLFCRTLRFLLGESNFGTKELTDNLHEAIPNLWAVASLRVGEKSWIIGRAMSGAVGGAKFAIQSDELTTAFSAVPAMEGYDEFLSHVQESCTGDLTESYPNDHEAWRHLLPWLARDQEARFAAITAWRDSLSEADNPRISVEAQHLIFRAILNLLAPEEISVRREISEWREKIKNWESRTPNAKATAKRDREKVERTLQTIPDLKIDLDDLDGAKTRIESQRTIREEAIEQYKTAPEKTEVTEARQKLSAAQTAFTRIETRITSLDEQIPNLEANAKKALELVDLFKKKGLRDPKRVDDNMCPNSFLYAQDRECVPKSEADEETQNSIEELEKRAAERTSEIEAKKTERSNLETEKEQAEAVVEERKIALYDAITSAPNPIANTQASITTLELAESQIDDLAESEDEVSEISQNIQDGNKKLEELIGKLEVQKSDISQRLQGFSDIFSDILRSVLGTSVTAQVELSSKNLVLRAKRTRNLGGAALETIKMIAFDLAAIMHSSEGKSDFPRFLLHDGPREADMAEVVYEQFFYHVLRLERQFKSGAPNFQYILTTTTPPPENMRGGSVWLLGEKLSGKSKEGRLLMEDF